MREMDNKTRINLQQQQQGTTTEEPKDKDRMQLNSKSKKGYYDAKSFFDENEVFSKFEGHARNESFMDIFDPNSNILESKFNVQAVEVSSKDQKNPFLMW